MERFNKASEEFIKAIKDTGRDTAIDDGLIDTAPESITAYGINKVAAKITENIHPLDLRDLLLREYGIDWLNWLPEVTTKTFMDNQKNELLENKIQALRISIKTDFPWLEWHIFEKVGKSFNNQIPNFGIMQPLSVGECYTTMEILNKIRPDEIFSDEVLSYVASVAADQQYVYLPLNTPLEKAQKYLDNLIHDLELRDKVQAAWEKIKDREILEAEINDENPLHVQLQQLAVMKKYVEELNGEQQ